MVKGLVSIIIINWNGKNFLKVLLPSIKKNSYKNYEIIIVDNGSTDGSFEYVARNFPKSIIIKNNSNLGFAKANNQGLERAKGEMVLFLNNDTKVTKNFLAVLVNKLNSDKKNGACQPKILLSERKDTLDSIGSFLTNTGFLYHYGFEAKNSKKLDKQIKLFSGKGSCLLFKKKVLDEIGNFNEDFFAYFEETDLCWRLWLAGYHVLYIPEAQIFHKSWGTARKLKQETINFHSFKNRIASLLLNLGTFNLVKILPVHLITCFFIVFFYLITGKPKIGLAIMQAIYWNLKHLNEILKKRKLVQIKIRKVGDSILLPEIMKNASLAFYLRILNYSFVRSKIFQQKML